MTSSFPAIGSGFPPTGPGSAYVVFWSHNRVWRTLDLAALDGTDGFRIDGVTVGDTAGSSVANAGDVNGDGIDDLIIGARSADNNGASSGSAYVVFGRIEGFDPTLSLASLNGANGFRIDGALPGDAMGTGVASVGDVNGDGFDDFLVGGNNADQNGTSSGSVYVVFGQADGFGPILDLGSIDGTNGSGWMGPTISIRFPGEPTRAT